MSIGVLEGLTNENLGNQGSIQGIAILSLVELIRSSGTDVLGNNKEKQKNDDEVIDEVVNKLRKIYNKINQILSEEILDLGNELKLVSLFAKLESLRFTVESEVSNEEKRSKLSKIIQNILNIFVGKIGEIGTFYSRVSEIKNNGDFSSRVREILDDCLYTDIFKGIEKAYREYIKILRYYNQLKKISLNRELPKKLEFLLVYYSNYLTIFINSIRQYVRQYVDDETHKKQLFDRLDNIYDSLNEQDTIFHSRF